MGGNRFRWLGWGAVVGVAMALSACGGGGGAVAPVDTDAACASLRSGRHVVLDPQRSEPELALGHIVVDTASRTLSLPGLTGDTRIPYTDEGGCSLRITAPQAQVQIAVSRSGMALAVTTITQGDNQGRLEASWMIPEQAIGVAELAGEWNALEFADADAVGTRVPARLRLSIDASGRVGRVSRCGADDGCAELDLGAAVGFEPHAGGGFLVGNNVLPEPFRAIAFRPEGGPLSMVMLYPGATGLLVAAQQTAIALPPSGQVQRSWGTLVRPNGQVLPFSEGLVTITGVDAAARTITRLITGGLADSFSFDNPEVGLRRRSAGSCSRDGAATACAAITALPLPGTGMLVYIGGQPDNSFGVVVDRP